MVRIPPRLMFGAPHGRSGKTIISCGVGALLSREGFTVQPFKKGPDYIDSSWLQAACKMICRNLDTFLMPEETLVTHFRRTVAEADIALIEGNMGLYDGVEEDGRGSSAQLARLLKTPVILVINTARMARSVAAMVKGYQNFEHETPVAGVILNNVSGERHKRKLIRAIEDNCSIPVLGVVPRDEGLHIKERHLGLVPFNEDTTGSLIIERITRIMEKHIDLNALLSIAQSAPEVECNDGEKKSSEQKRSVRIGIFFDRAFHFYYPENLEALESYGAQLIYIDSLSDHELPSIDALYIGGGFPELYLQEIEANRGLMEDIARAIEEGLPVYAECAGLMYLSRGVDIGNKIFRMAGVIPSEIGIRKRPEGHGYIEAEVIKENPFYPVGTKIKGHEFHYSYLKDTRNLHMIMKITRGRGIDGGDGIIYKNMFASYTHIHALGVQSWPENFLMLALYERYSKKSKKEVFYG